MTVAVDLSLLAAALHGTDPKAQNDAVAAAIDAGAEAVPALLLLFAEPEVARHQIVYALERIGDARAVAVFEAGLDDTDERVRAYAARGLAGIGHPGALAALLAKLNDAADPLHLDRTPAVDALAGFGLDAVGPLLERMLDDDAMTRLHAQRALQLIVAQRLRGVSAETLRTTWQQRGDYAWDAHPGPRRAAVEAWRTWLDEQRKS